MIRSGWIFAAVLGAALGGCAGRQPSPKNSAHEDDCKAATAMLLADRDAGRTCPEGKEHARTAYPGCPLVISCDHGAPGPAGAP